MSKEKTEALEENREETAAPAKPDHFQEARKKLTVDQWEAIKDHFQALSQEQLDVARSEGEAWAHKAAVKEIQEKHILIPAALDLQQYFDRLVQARINSDKCDEQNMNQVIIRMISGLIIKD